MLYVADLVNCVEKLIDNPGDKPFRLYNVGAGEGIAIRDLVQRVIDVSGKKLDIEYDTSKPSIPTKVVLDCQKIQNELGWKSEISLEEGLSKSIAWYKEHIANLNRI